MRLKETYLRLCKTHPEISCRVLTRMATVIGNVESNDGFLVRRIRLTGESHMKGARLVKIFRQIVTCFMDVRLVLAELKSVDPKNIDIVHTGGWSWLVFSSFLFCPPQ